jgi:hypothetical protein
MAACCCTRYWEERLIGSVGSSSCTGQNPHVDLREPKEGSREEKR